MVGADGYPHPIQLLLLLLLTLIGLIAAGDVGMGQAHVQLARGLLLALAITTTVLPASWSRSDGAAFARRGPASD